MKTTKARVKKAKVQVCEKEVRKNIKKEVCNLSTNEINTRIDNHINRINNNKENIEIIERLKYEASEMATIILKRHQNSRKNI